MSDFFSTLLRLVSLIPQLLVVGACFYFLLKKASIEAILLSIGSSAGILLSLFYTFLPYLLQKNGMSFSSSTKLYSILGGIGFFFGLCFSIGLIMLIVNTLKNNRQANNQTPFNKDF